MHSFSHQAGRNFSLAWPSWASYRLRPMSVLRPYQAEALASARAAFAKGLRSVLLVAPTGAGKGTIAAHVLATAAQRGKRAAFLVHRAELVRDIAQRLTAHGVPSVSVEMGQETDRRSDALVTVATVQTLAARTYADDACDLLVVDEAHHATCATYQGVLQRCPSARVLGLTATPQRHDGTGLGDTFDEMVVAATMSQLTEAGFLVPARVYAPAKRSSRLAEDPATAYLLKGQGRKAVVFSSSVQAALDTSKALNGMGITATSISAADPYRKQAVEAFKAGRVQVIVNVGILTEGFDDPSVSCVVVARGVGHVGAWLQIVGRGLRPAPGKTDAIILDLCGSVWWHGLPAEDREWTLDGTGCKAGVAAEQIRQCPACGAVYRASQWDASTCPGCGHEMPARKAPAVVRAELAEVKASALARGDVDGRIRALRDYAAESKAKSFKPGWKMIQFRQRFGRYPSKHERKEAGL